MRDDLTKRDTDYIRECRGLTCPENVLSLCDTCESLRAEVERLEVERDAFRLHHVEACHDLHARAEKAEAHDRETCECLSRRTEERDEFATEATFAREDKRKAERERDEARRDHCAAAAKAENYTADGRRQPYTARDIAREVYPAAADALFPVEAKP